MNLARFQNIIDCAYQNSGLEAKVVFQRINKVLSPAADPIFREREESTKVYKSYTIWAIVEENPRRNVYGPGGGEVIGDLMVTWYGDKGADEDNDFEVYIPDEADRILWRGIKYEITKKEPISPYGENQQLGWMVVGTRFS